MADFGVASTQLSDPQGQGTAPVAAVQENVSMLGMSPVIGEVVNIFAKGLKDNAKAEAEKRKNAVIGEYINNETVYGQAFSSGQWNASQSSASSRANFTKFANAYPEYLQDISQARSQFFGGSEAGVIQKKEEVEAALREEDKKQASSRGYTFYPGMSEEVTNKTIDVSKRGIRVEKEFAEYTSRTAEQRAAASEGRAQMTHDIMLDDRVQKERVVTAANEIVDRNFDLVDATAKDLQLKMANGTISPEDAMMAHQANIKRIEAGLLATAGKFPEMVAPYTRLFADMDANIRARLDPKTKSADELARLQNEYNILITKGKLTAISVPEIKDAVIKSTLFPSDTMIALSAAPVIQKWVLGASGLIENSPPPAQAVGTPDDVKIFQNAKKAIGDLQSGKIAPDKSEKATIEATNLVNTLLKQTTTVDGSIDPRALKQASSFYASTEFGRLALAGKIDKQTAANAQQVFQVKYDPAVKQAIIGVLDKDLGGGDPMSNHVDIKMVGSNVVFTPKYVPAPTSVGDMLDGFMSKGLKNIDINSDTAELKSAAAGLNQLIRMHAHLEGTTDYGKYWEENKYMLMPGYFMKDVKEGTIKGGYKFLGGDARNPKNWEQQASGK